MAADFALNASHGWAMELSRRLPLLGHRNWIVVADSAYPFQSNPGIETIPTNSDHIEVVKSVQSAIAGCHHIRANVYIDMELDFIEESDAPGVSAYRQQLYALPDCSRSKRIPHEQVIAKLDECARRFGIVIFKTTMAIPYSSVFFELDCGYWNAEAEEKLRQAMEDSPSEI